MITSETDAALQALNDAGVPCEIEEKDGQYSVRILKKDGEVWSQTTLPAEDQCIDWIKQRAGKIYSLELKKLTR